MGKETKKEAGGGTGEKDTETTKERVKESGTATEVASGVGMNDIGKGREGRSESGEGRGEGRRVAGGTVESTVGGAVGGAVGGEPRGGNGRYPGGAWGDSCPDLTNSTARKVVRETMARIRSFIKVHA